MIPGGSPKNPMGAAAMTIAGGEYAIHGTNVNVPGSVGGFVSYGCIRMLKVSRRLSRRTEVRAIDG